VIPVGDSIRLRRVPLCTWSIALAIVAAFVLQVTLPPAEGELLVRRMGVVPVHFLAEWSAVLRDPGLLAGGLGDFLRIAVLPCLAYQFLHGGWVHLVGNLAFLLIFGDQVEDRLGRLRFLGFYLLCGTASVLLHVFMSPALDVPVVGASGAIAGCLGANLLLFPGARVTLLVPILFLITAVEIPAWVMLLGWFVVQLPWVHRILGVGGVETVAYWAHVGGFVAGLLLGPLLCIGTRPRRRGAA
jgi:membrane associated rhomboid family serine protease